MPSDLSIAKLQGTTAPVEPVTKADQEVNSHRKAASLRDKFPNVYSTEDLPKIVDTLGDYGLAYRMAKNYTPRERAQDADTTVRNLAGAIVGWPADTLKMMYDAWRLTPGGQVAPSSEDSLLDAFTIRRLQEQFGGDPEHWSALPSEVLAPGPGELKGVMAFGRVAARRLPNQISRLDEAMEMGVEKADPFNMDIARKTGWYKGDDGELKFLVDDSDIEFPWLDKLEETAELNINRMKDLGVKASYGTFEAPLEQVVDFPELFQAYPELRKLPVSIKYRRDIGGDITVTTPGADSGGRNVLGSITDKKNGDTYKLTLQGSSGDHPWKEVLMHEIQHTVQNLEGFARGGSGQVLAEPVETLAGNFDQLEVIRIIDKDDVDSIDDIGSILETEFKWDEKRINNALRRTDVQAYIGAKMDDDYASMDLITRETAANLSTAAEKINWVLEYMDPKDVENAMNILSESFAKHGKNRLPYLFNRAYKHLKGEAEARVAGSTSGMSLKEVLDRGLFDYRKTDEAIEVAAGRGEQHPRVKGRIMAEGDGTNTAESALPEGTQQKGTLEELFGSAKPNVEWPQAHYQDFVDVLTPELAVDALMNPQKGTPHGAVREAARKILFNDPMKYRSKDEILARAKELGVR